MTRNIIVVVLAFFLTGCASSNYQYGVGEQAAIDAPLAPKMKQQFLIGKPHWFWDQSDWIWPLSWAGKLLFWNRNFESHTISDETIDVLKTYIEDNQLENVQVLVNDYRPGVQWQRLFRNRTVGAGWRYTLGVLTLVQYTVMPGRFFGGDHYNPYTNTISLYSNDIGIALHEAGHAKDSNEKRYKGTYAFSYAIPPGFLYFEAKASSEALSYLHDKDMISEEKQAYQMLHPAYGTYVASLLSGGLFADYSRWVILPAVLMGHVTGNIAAATVNRPEHGSGHEDE